MKQGTRGLLVALVLVLVAIAAFVWTLRSGGGDANLDVANGKPVASESGNAKAGALEAGDGATQGKTASAPLRTELAPANTPPVVAQAGPTVALTGRFVLAAGTPIAGVELRCDDVDGDWGIPIRAPGTDAKGKNPKSDADGRFRVQVPKGKKLVLQITSREHLFSADSGRDHGERTTRDLKACEQDTDLGNMTLVAAGLVSGVVQDTTGKPLADARVRMLADGSDLGLFSLGSNDGEKTDAKGAFTIGSIPSGRTRLHFSARGHVPSKLDLELGAGERKTGVVVQLATGFAIAGRVVDDTGKPIADARVVAQRKSLEGTMSIETTQGDAGTRTDASGSFLLTGLDDHIATIFGSARGHLRQKQADVAVGSNDVVLRLSRLAAIEGVLVDTLGKPIANSGVHGNSDVQPEPFLDRNAFAKTGSDGTFKLTNVIPGTATLHAEGESHRPTEPTQIKLGPGETVTGVRLVATVGAAVAAIVRDGNGEPVVGATVEVRRPGAAQETPHSGGTVRSVRRVVRSASPGGFAGNLDQDQEVLGSAQTDKEGKATVRGLPAGAVVVSAAHAKYAAAKPVALTLPETGTTEASFAVTKGGIATIAVVDADRVPLKEAQVSLTGPLGDAGLAKTHTVRSDEKGVAQATALTPGRYSAHLVAASEPMQFGSARVVLGDSETIEESRVEFTIKEDETTSVSLVQPLMATLTGVVSDAKGVVKGAEVELTKANENTGSGSMPFGRQKRGKTDADGTYKVENLLPGKYTVSYGRKNALAKHEDSVTIQTGQRSVEKNLLLQGGTVQVAVVSAADGTPIKKAKVSLQQAESTNGGQPRRQRAVMFSIAMTSSGNGDDEPQTSMMTNEQAVQTDDEGKATLEDVPPGRWRVEIEHNKHAPCKVPAFDLAPAAVLDLGVQKLTAGGTIAGDVEQDGEKGMMLAMVQIAREGQKDEDAERMPAMQGSFRKPGLAPGKYRLRAAGVGEAAEHFGPWKEVEVKPGETARVKLEAPK